MTSTKQRIQRIVATALIAGSVGAAAAVAPASATVITNAEDSFLTCFELSNMAALYFPLNSAPRYAIYAIRIDRGTWRYAHMYFAYGQEWQLLNGRWVATGANWAGIWAPDDGRRHLVEVLESRSRDNRTFGPWLTVNSPCYTSTLWAPMF